MFAIAFDMVYVYVVYVSLHSCMYNFVILPEYEHATLILHGPAHSSSCKCTAIFLPDPDIWKGLQIQRTQTRSPDIIQDVFDGAEYRRHIDFLSNPNNISLICNSDGVAIFTLSSVELWPIWLSINELPKKER